ncbi:MAG: TIGR01906 family membrane protein [Chloroflexi bacterium]|nr:TIGR01906 family membrane protein [Chloroflexota bacterium]
MRILATTTKWAFMLSLPVLLLTASIGGAFNSLWLYKYGFARYEISRSTGLAVTELDKAARGLISYFNSAEESISLTVVKDSQPFALFNQREIIHLSDVKALVWLDYQLLLGTLIYASGYVGISLLWRRKRYWRRLARGVVGGSSLTLALMLALGSGTLLGFDQLFLQFHWLSFANDFWQLDPTRDYLVMLFPRGFWYDATLFITLATAGTAIIFGGVAGGYLLKLRVSRDLS